MVATTIEKAPTHPLAAFLPIQWALDADRLALVGKAAQIIGCVAGVLTGFYDFFKSWTAWTAGSKGFAILFGISGALGCAAALAGYFASAFFWPLLVLSFIVGIVIALVSNSALKDWMSRCYFSNGVSGVRAATHGKPPFKPYPYPSANDEFNAYKSAMGS